MVYHCSETLGLHCYYGVAQACRRPVTKVLIIINDGNDHHHHHHHQRRATLGARQSVFPVRTDQQGRNLPHHCGGGREPALADQVAQHRLYDFRAQRLGRGRRGRVRARRGGRCELCCRFYHSFPLSWAAWHMFKFLMREVSVTFFSFFIV